jgi:hypothetical protein
MNKYFMMVAIAATALLTTTACSSDNDNNGNGPSTSILPAPDNAEKAGKIIMDTETPAAAASSEAIKSKFKLKELWLSEGGLLTVSLYTPGQQQKTFISEKAIRNGNVYTVNGKNLQGTVELAEATRSFAPKFLKFNLKTMVSNGDFVQFVFEGDDFQFSQGQSTGQATATICRLWNINAITLKITSEGTQPFSKTYKSSNAGVDFRPALADAKENGVSLTEEEEKEFERTASHIDLSNNKVFQILYADHTPDVAKWAWEDTAKTKFSITLENSDMGNKFINNDTEVSSEFNGNLCNLSMKTKISDTANKQWNIELRLNLQAAQ